LGRKFSRISLGGMHDEAEIPRASPGRTSVRCRGQIIQHLKRVEVKDPVFMLDEIDKLGRDFRGDPASALLGDARSRADIRSAITTGSAVRSEQVLFICTANQLDTIPGHCSIVWRSSN